MKAKRNVQNAVATGVDLGPRAEKEHLAVAATEGPRVAANGEKATAPAALAVVQVDLSSVRARQPKAQDPAHAGLIAPTAANSASPRCHCQR